MAATVFTGGRVFDGTGAEPAVYRSSPGVERLFCGRCGAPVAYRSAAEPGETHFYAAALDDPEAVTPDRHVFNGEKLSWLHLADDLPKHEGGTP